MATIARTFPTKKIGDIARVIPGFAFKSKDWCNAGFLVIKIKNIEGDGSINTDDADCVPASLMNPKLEKFLVRNGDILVAMTGATAGKVGRLRSSQQFLLNQRVAKLIPVDIHPLFFWSIVSSDDYQGRFFKLADGAAQPNMSGSQIEGVEVPFPSLPAQRKIAAILSAYDDLIENNLRRIKILEEIAQNLYHEWFVKFLFPGHQHTRFTDSPLGRIPERWEFQRLDELCSAVLDGDWIETKDQGGEDYRLLQISNIGVGDFVETGKFRYVTQETFDRLRCAEIQPDDLLIARMPTPIGRGWLARKMPWRIITAVDVAIARPDIRRISPVFLLHFWNQPSTLATIEKQSSGTTRLRITRRELCAMPIPTPSIDLQEQFSAKARPMLDLANILRDKNTTLRRTRDLLLPRLISGELDASDLEIAIPEEAEA
jgi:type I restriction enzyme S subunit